MRVVRDGPFPRCGRGTPAGFAVHAALALAALVVLNLLVTYYVPFSIMMIGSSYLIFFYHFPAAINVFLFYGWTLVACIAYLVTRDAVWDRRARVACEVGIVANAILLVTGATWAKAAWNSWWVWNDPRLMSAAVMSLTYLGYATLQYGIEDPVKRRTFAAVYGVLAFLNIPVVHFSIRWFGQASHPMTFSPLSDPEIVRTRWYAVAAFFAFYLLIYRWKYEVEALRDGAEEVLARSRAIEEGKVGG